MEAKLIGVMGVDFSNNQGEKIQGTNIFVAFKDENVQGLRTEKFFLKSDIDIPDQTKVNDTLNLVFNHKGKIESLSKA